VEGGARSRKGRNAYADSQKVEEEGHSTVQGGRSWNAVKEVGGSLSHMSMSIVPVPTPCL
jgi:hypothetical protein